MAKILWTGDKIEKLGKELVSYVSKDGIYHICSFLAHKHMLAQTYYDMVKRYPLLAEYHGVAMEILAHKLIKASMEKSPNQWVIKTYLPRYMNDRKQLEDESYRDELIKAKAKLEAIDNAVSNKGAISEYIESQKAIKKILDD